MKISSMRVTIDINEAILSDIMELTGEKMKSSAVAKAVEEFVRRRKASAFGLLIRESAFDYPNTTEDADPIPPLRLD